MKPYSKIIFLIILLIPFSQAIFKIKASDSISVNLYHLNDGIASFTTEKIHTSLKSLKLLIPAGADRNSWAIAYFPYNKTLDSLDSFSVYTSFKYAAPRFLIYLDKNNDVKADDALLCNPRLKSTDSVLLSDYQDASNGDWKLSTGGLRWGWAEASGSLPWSPLDYWKSLYGKVKVLYIGLGLEYSSVDPDGLGEPLYADEVVIREIYSIEPSPRHPSVTIDTFVTNASRVDVGTTQSIRLHAKWDNGTDVSNGLIYINGEEYKTNSGGWAIINVNSQTVGKTTWRVTAINCSGITDFTQSAASPSIIWDRVNVTLSIIDDRIDIISKPELEWSAIYEYDGSQFQGEVNIKTISSQTSVPTPVGKGVFIVESIEDDRYGLTAFTSNQVDCIWDRVKITQGGVSKSMAKTGDTESVWFKAVYEYDNEEFTGDKGEIFVNNIPLLWSSFDRVWKYSTKLDDNGKLTFEVSGVEDRQYKLTKFIDAAGPQSITWEKPFLETPVGIASIAAVLAIIVAGVIFFLRKRI
jgi:hypothetical protein